MINVRTVVEMMITVLMISITGGGTGQNLDLNGCQRLDTIMLISEYEYF